MVSLGELKILGLLFDVRNGRALERHSRKIDGRTKMSDNANAAPPSERRITKTSQAMRGNELIKKVEALGKESGIAVRIDKKRGREVIKRFISATGRRSFETRRTN
jgi:hypothetical protein